MEVLGGAHQLGIYLKRSLLPFGCYLKLMSLLACLEMMWITFNVLKGQQIELIHTVLN